MAWCLRVEQNKFMEMLNGSMMIYRARHFRRRENLSSRDDGICLGFYAQGIVYVYINSKSSLPREELLPPSQLTRALRCCSLLPLRCPFRGAVLVRRTVFARDELKGHHGQQPETSSPP